MTTDDIEDEIERTREEMADTLDAIERKLSPKQLMDQVVDAMRDLANDQSRAVQIVRENPLPLALIGVGLGWLAVAGARNASSGTSRVGSYESMEGVSAPWGAETASEGIGGYGYAPGAETPSYGSIAQNARESAIHASDKVAGKVAEWKQQARVSAKQAAGRTRDAYQDHPLAMGLVATLVGAAVGALLPRSRVEAEGLGKAGSDFVRQARATGAELADKAGRIAERAASAAKTEGERAFRQESGQDTAPGTASSMTH